MRNKKTAALFALFFGGFGVHKWYLGKINQGIIYGVLCWTLVPTVISIFEGITYLSMSQEEFDNKFNTYKSNLDVLIEKNTTQNSNISIAEEIEKLHKLKESGVLTEEEFTNRKSKLL